MTHVLAGLPESHISNVAAAEDEGSYSITRRLWSAVCDKIFECTEQSTDQNSSSTVPGLWPHTARRSTHLLQEFGWEVFNHLPPHSPDLVPNDIFFLHLKNFRVRSASASASSEWQRGGHECHRCSNSRRQTSTTQDRKVGPTLWQMSQFRMWICSKIAQYLLYQFQ